MAARRMARYHDVPVFDAELRQVSPQPGKAGADFRDDAVDGFIGRQGMLDKRQIEALGRTTG